MTDTSVSEYDIAIIGAGPVGLFSVFACGMLGMKVVVIDGLANIGGQCSALYPEKPIYDIPSHPEINGAQLIHQLKTQAAPFSPVYKLGVQVTSFQGSAGDFTLQTSDGDGVRCKAIIVAAGAGAFVPNRPPLKDLDLYEGKSVFYSVFNPDDFKGRSVVITGGGDSAVDWACSLQARGAQVTLVHRRDKFRALDASVDALHKSGVKLMIPYQLDRLEGDNGKLRSVIAKTIDGSTEEQIPADVLLPFFGLKTSLGPLADWGFGITKKQINVCMPYCETSISGIYAVGDVAHYEGKLKLILNGFSESSYAAHHAYQYVFPGKPLKFEHSTDKGIPS